MNGMLLLCQALHQTRQPSSNAPVRRTTWGAGGEGLAKRQIPTQNLGEAWESAVLCSFQVRITFLNPNLHTSFTSPYEADTLTLSP